MEKIIESLKIVYEENFRPRELLVNPVCMKGVFEDTLLPDSSFRLPYQIRKIFEGWFDGGEIRNLIDLCSLKRGCYDNPIAITTLNGNYMSYHDLLSQASKFIIDQQSSRRNEDCIRRLQRFYKISPVKEAIVELKIDSVPKERRRFQSDKISTFQIKRFVY